jgi:hypothetical protein
MAEILGVSVRKNLLIGGNFSTNPWQKGTSFSLITASNWYADRWLVARDYGIYQFTVTKEAISPANSVSGASHCLRYTRPVGGAESGVFFVVSQNIEQKDTIAAIGKYVTFSCWAKCGSAWYTEVGTKALSMVIDYSTNGTESQSVTAFGTTASTLSAGWNFIASQNITMSDTEWRFFSLTAKVPTNATQLAVRFTGRPGIGAPTGVVNEYFEIAQCQLEVGQQPSSFESISAADVLRLCKRYYYQNTRGGVKGIGISSSTMMIHGEHPVEMRSTPSASLVSGGDYTFVDGTTAYIPTAPALSGTEIDSKGFRDFQINGFSGLTAYRPYTIAKSNVLQFSAEI